MAGIGTVSGNDSFRFDNNESTQSLISRRGSVFGSRFSLSDDSGVYVSSLALTIIISAVAMIGIIFAAVTITLAVMFVACQKDSETALHSQRLHNSDQRLHNSDQCSSFVLNAELNNLQGWILPENCEKHVEAYMNGGQYENDVAIALSGAKTYLKNVNPQDDGKDVVVMDIDETALSNLPYYRNHHYGTEEFNEELWDEWVNESNAPALKPMLDFYRDIQSAKWNIIFMTGRPEQQRNKTIENLLFAGYKNWLMLILRSANEVGIPAKDFKTGRRQRLEEEGYRIASAFGDQWSDNLGPAAGNKTFKLPNPMYYIY